MKTLTIISVRHYKKGLYEQLMDFYKKVDPDAICLEYSNSRQVINLRNEISANFFAEIMCGLPNNKLSGQEVRSAMNYTEYIKRTPIYCIDRFHLMGRLIIPLVRSSVPKKIKLKAIDSANRLREWGIIKGIIKLFNKYRNVLLVIGRGHVRALNKKLINERLTISIYYP